MKSKDNNFFYYFVFSLETAVLALIMFLGMVPFEFAVPAIFLGSGGELSFVMLFWISFITLTIVTVVKMFIISHLLHYFLPGGVLATLLKLAIKTKSFKAYYEKSIKSIADRKMMSVNITFFIFGLLPLPLTQVAVIACATTKYYQGIIPLLLGSACKILIATLGAYHGIPWIESMFN